MSEKKKIFVLADHPFTPSGVGTQTRYFIEALLKTGRYSFVCFGGAIKHENYQPMKTEEWGEDWIIYPQPTNPGKRLILNLKLDL